jgi:hypothetical protein
MKVYQGDVLENVFAKKYEKFLDSQKLSNTNSGWVAGGLTAR